MTANRVDFGTKAMATNSLADLSWLWQNAVWVSIWYSLWHSFFQSVDVLYRMPDGDSIGNKILSEGCQTLTNATFSPFFLMEIGFNALWCLSSSVGPLNFRSIRNRAQADGTANPAPFGDTRSCISRIKAIYLVRACKSARDSAAYWRSRACESNLYLPTSRKGHEDGQHTRVLRSKNGTAD